MHSQDFDKPNDLLLSPKSANGPILESLLQVFIPALFIIILSFIFLYIEIIAPFIYAQCGGIFDGTQTPSLIFVALYAFLCFFLLPALAARYIFKESLCNLGLQLPVNNIKTALLITLAILLLAPLMYFFSQQAQCQAYYSLGNISLTKFVLIHATLVPIYYFAEEFFFRGFLFLGLWKRIGWHSYWITEVLFVVAHFSKPGLEILLSIPAGVVLSYLTIKTKSVYPAMIVHYTMGLLLNIWVNYTL